MITGFLKNAEIFSEMEKSEFYFHLTGNHFFSGNTPEQMFDEDAPDQDYTFFSHNCSEVIEFLYDLGFEEDPTSACNDDNTACVMILEDYPFSIQVQVVYDVEKKIKVQNIIDKHFKSVYMILPRFQCKEFWNSMYHVYDEFQS